MPRRPQPPKLTRHKSGQGRVRIDGRDRYLGVWGPDEKPSPEVKRAFDKVLLEWRLSQSGGGGSQVFHLIERYILEHGLVLGAKLGPHDCVRRKMTQHVLCLDHLALRRVSELVPADLEGFMHHLAALTDEKPGSVKGETVTVARYTRSTVNKYAQLFRQMIRWGERKGHVPPGTLHRLAATQLLRYGETPAREPEPIGPVSDAVIDATLEHLAGAVPDLVRFQRLVGCRPGEACSLRLADTHEKAIETDRGVVKVLLWTLTRHKTAHHGMKRVIAIGPKAMMIVSRNATTSLDAPVFRTAEGKPYRRDSYTTAIARAAKKAGVEHWSPNQLRHARATELNDALGIEVAGAVLGHGKLETTQIYAQKRERAALEAAALTG